MSFLSALRSLDARAIGAAFAVAYIAVLPLGWLLGVLAFAATADADLTESIQSRFGLAAWFAAPFVAGAVAARWARQTPLYNGMAVALLGTAVQLLLMDFSAAWMPIAMIIGGFASGLIGAFMGRAIRPKPK
jgi:hypothetical protein